MELPWQEWQKKLEDLNQQLIVPDLDQKQRSLLQKEHARLSLLLGKVQEIEHLKKTLSETRSHYESSLDTEMKQLYQEEVENISQALNAKERELENILFPPDPLNNRSVFLEVRAGTGGQEAALFATDLVTMYTNYALKKGWRVSVVDLSETDLGGIREATLHIEGDEVYGHLKHEGGVHRVQRIPKTETAGRVHTSTATVAVLPEVDEVDIHINPADLRIDTYRAGGAGGQHVNKTDSAVRITHIPTGIVVACQQERSQHKNRASAMKMLQARLVAAQREKQESEASQKRKEMVGSAMRAEKVRTYNFPQNRVTDHQVDVTLKKLDMVMEGDLDDIIEPLRTKEQEERKKNII